MSTLTWSPAWAPHVNGSTKARDEDGEQVVQIACTKCGGNTRRRCSSGLWREKVQAFAMDHLHRDPLETGFQSKKS